MRPANLAVDVRAQLPQEGVRLGQVLAVRPLALVEVRHGIQPHAIHAHLQPEIDDPEELLVDGGIVEIQVGLMGVEAVPEVGLGHRVPRPVRGLEILEDDPRIAVPPRVSLQT